MRGAKVLVPNGDECGALGYAAERINDVPAGSLAALQDRPPDGTLLKERGGDQVWVYEGGKKRHITNPTVFEQRGYRWGNIKTVPTGSTSDFGDGVPVQ
jgi:hypothetical protein